MNEKKRKPYEEVIPLHITLPTSFDAKRSKETNIGVPTGESIMAMKDWVNFNAE